MPTMTPSDDMTRDFVGYSPDLERIDPNFEDSLRTVLETMRRYIAGSTRGPGTGRAVRDTHAKAYGLARAEVEILDSAPAAYAQGIYAEPGRHEALVRFSNGSAHMGPDILLGNVVGIGLRILGIDGPALLEDEPDCGTFDYALINHPVFFVNTLEHYGYIQKLLFQRGLPPPANDTPELARARFQQLLYDFLTGMGRLPRERWAWDELGVFLAARTIRARVSCCTRTGLWVPCGMAITSPKCASHQSRSSPTRWRAEPSIQRRHRRSSALRLSQSYASTRTSLTYRFSYGQIWLGCRLRM
jgi:hypothetical protein